MKILVAKININGTQVEVTDKKPVTSGMVGATVRFTFDDAWAGLSKTAVFEAGEISRDVLITGDVVTIPHECIAKPGCTLKVGVYGTDAEENLAMPTVYGTIDWITRGADPSGDPSADPTLPVWEQLRAMIETGGGGEGGSIDPESIKEAVDEYLAENPPAQGKDGKDGQDGITPDIQIGTVETLEPEAEATASFTGTAEKPILNLGIPRGKPGEGSSQNGDYIPAPETAEVGQTIVVKAVDESGKPTEWEAEEIFGELPLISSITLTEPTTTVEITTDSEGNALSLNEWDVLVHIPGVAATTYAPKIYLYAIDGDTSGYMYEFAYNDNSASNCLRNRSLFGNWIEYLASRYFTITNAVNYLKYFPNGVHSSGIKIYTYNNEKPMPIGTIIEIRGK